MATALSNTVYASVLATHVNPAAVWKSLNSSLSQNSCGLPPALLLCWTFVSVKHTTIRTFPPYTFHTKTSILMDEEDWLTVKAFGERCHPLWTVNDARQLNVRISSIASPISPGAKRNLTTPSWHSSNWSWKCVCVEGHHSGDSLVTHGPGFPAHLTLIVDLDSSWSLSNPIPIN